jgi:hypothetical protein
MPSYAALMQQHRENAVDENTHKVDMDSMLQAIRKAPPKSAVMLQVPVRGFFFLLGQI